MAKRVIHECDLSKQEISEDDTIFTLKLTKKGTRSNMTYELSSASAEKLLAQLNSRNELDDNWSFEAEVQEVFQPQRPKRTLGDLEDEVFEEPEESDAGFVAEKKAELREAGVIEEERELSSDTPVSKALGAVDGCTHINKSRIKITMRGKKRFAYRNCIECGKEIEEASAEGKKSYMTAKAPKGTNVRSID